MRLADFTRGLLMSGHTRYCGSYRYSWICAHRKVEQLQLTMMLLAIALHWHARCQCTQRQCALQAPPHATCVPDCPVTARVNRVRIIEGNEAPTGLPTDLAFASIGWLAVVGVAHDSVGHG